MMQRVAERSSHADSLQRSEILASEDYKNGKVAAVQKLMELSFKVNFCDTLAMSKLQLTLPDNYIVASLSYEGWQNEMKNYDVSKLISELACPILIIHGTCDVIPLEASEQLRALTRRGTLLVYPNAGHFSFIEQNKQVIKDLKKFLQRVGNP